MSSGKSSSQKNNKSDKNISSKSSKSAKSADSSKSGSYYIPGYFSADEIFGNIYDNFNPLGDSIYE